MDNTNKNHSATNAPISNDYSRGKDRLHVKEKEFDKWWKETHKYNPAYHVAKGMVKVHEMREKRKKKSKE